MSFEDNQSSKDLGSSCSSNSSTNTNNNKEKQKNSVVNSNDFNCTTSESDEVEDVLDCTSPARKPSSSSMTQIATPYLPENNPHHINQMMKNFVVDEESGKLVQVPIDEEELQDYFDDD